MRKILLLSVILFKSSFLFAQISYQKNFDHAIKKAAETSQPIFLTVGTPTQLHNKSAIDNPDVVSFYNKNFVSYAVNMPNAEAVAFMRKYQLKVFPAYLFLDKNGVLIFKGDKNSSSSAHYLTLARKALEKLSSGLSLGDYDAKYKSGKVDKDFLKEYIILRQQLGMQDNAKLIDEYIDYLTVGSFNDYNEVLFVLKAGPFAYGKAYRLAYTNKKIIDSIYKTEPLRVRVEMNSSIIANSQKEAIATKNITMANSVANYLRGTWSKDYKEGQRRASLSLLNYYKAVKDTANFYVQAPYFYDRYFMNISIDSINKMAKVAADKRLALLKKGDSIKKSFPENPAAVRTTYSYSKISSMQTNDVANTLNNVAWDFYALGTKNINHLSKALIWSKRAIEISPTAEYYDTIAHLFYRMRLFDEALLNQAKAVDLVSKQKNGRDRIIRFKAEAEKMKQRQL